MVLVRRCDGFRSGSSHRSPDRLFPIFSRHRRSLSFLSAPVSCCCYRSGLLARILLGFYFSGRSCCLRVWWWFGTDPEVWCRGGEFFIGVVVVVAGLWW
ncbi:hypothetical protein QL285_083926 [Trifolium repens]|nr:hypothetical protein QL285_083926 [Trifolium repens]